MNFFTAEAIVGALVALSAFALVLTPFFQPSYASLRAFLLAQDLLEVIEESDLLLHDAYAFSRGDAGAILRLNAFLQQARDATGAKCVSLRARESVVSSACPTYKRSVVLRRLLFDGESFFFLEARVGY